MPLHRLARSPGIGDFIMKIAVHAGGASRPPRALLGVPVVLGKFWSDIPDLRKHVTGYL